MYELRSVPGEPHSAAEVDGIRHMSWRPTGARKAALALALTSPTITPSRNTRSDEPQPLLSTKNVAVDAVTGAVTTSSFRFFSGLVDDGRSGAAVGGAPAFSC